MRSWVRVPPSQQSNRKVFQWQEGLVWGQEGAGSSPALPTKKLKMNKLLWLDDIRDPYKWTPFWADRFADEDVVWVKNYEEFTKWITLNGLPKAINFDHDLADIHYNPWTSTESVEYDEKTGYECAKWLVDYCIDNNLSLPIWKCHSANPVGKKRIESYLTNFEKLKQ